MYLLHVRPIGSHKFEFDDEALDGLGREVNTDKLHLKSQGFGVRKEGEGAVVQDEGMPVGAGEKVEQRV